MSSRKSAWGASTPNKEPETPVGEHGRGSRAPRRLDDTTQHRQKSQKLKSPGLKSPLAPSVPTDPSARQKEGFVAEDGKESGDTGSKLSNYREQLVRDISNRGGHSPATKRPSPIQEESSFSPTPGIEMDLPTTTSTESGNTIRGGVTPGLIAATSVKTPSYPFPRMMTPGYLPPTLHRPFTALSPTIQALPGGDILANPSIHRMDRVMSNPSTPASTVTFQPAGTASSSGQHPDFPSPSLHELVLMLSSEPGLSAWWNTVVQIMTECYKAERVTLAMPADSTDIENIPWGQKATFNSQTKDDLSLGYMARGSSFVLSSTEVSSMSTSQERSVSFSSRPGLASRHSFTAYEENKAIAAPRGQSRLTPARPMFPRSKTSTAAPATSRNNSLSLPSAQGEPGNVLNRQALEEHDAEEAQQRKPLWEPPIGGSATENPARMLSVLQALDYEADPLIDHDGVQRILERGRVIALTRSYPYLDPETTDKLDGAATSGPSARSRHSEEFQKLGKKSRTDSATKLSSLLGSAAASKGPKAKKATTASKLQEDDPPRPRTPKYEEYEQAPPSPWSQSPAPSPAIRADPSVNPFFTDAMVDEETFNPTNPPQDYAMEQVPETIGVDNSWTVLHIPLIHPMSVKPTTSGFKLDTSIMEQKSTTIFSRLEGTGILSEAPSPGPTKTKHSPVAILSVLSPIIPYPSNLRHSIEHLAPHLATSFSLCRQYANLEAEVVGLHARRLGQVGFGAVASDGRPLEDPSTLAALAYLPSEDAQRSLAGSITSPSDYSGPGRSITNSPSGTPGWDSSTLGLVVDKRMGVSPSAQAGGGAEGYFSSRPATGQGGRYPLTPGASQQYQRTRKNSRDPSSEKRLSLKSSGSRTNLPELGAGERDIGTATEDTGAGSGGSAEDVMTTKKAGKEVRHVQREAGIYEIGPAKETRHTQLHSYGAEFSSVLQGLPPGTTIPKSTAQAVTPSRAGSVSEDKPNAPPSDRLKSLILDSLPVHVFVAVPRTGLIVWVNSRYMAYRGQTIESLADDPWSSIHPDEREDYLKAWSHSMRTGEQFSKTLRIRRFDGVYRWFQARALASRDKRNSVTHFYGSYMDIHDQHIAELKAARQEEIEASEAKHRILANLIPQIIFTATEEEGITFANEQWLSYTGQSFEDCLGLGFMDFVHPDDLAKCSLPNLTPQPAQPGGLSRQASYSGSMPKTPSTKIHVTASTPAAELKIPSKIVRQPLSRNSSSGSSNAADLAVSDLAELAELAKRGVIKISRDSDGRLSYTTEVRLRSKKNEYRWHLIRCVEIDNVDFGNGVSSYFGSVTDINDHKLLEAKLQEAMESKARFLSNMSHEIRTPLIGISGMVSFLQDSPLNEEQRDYTNTIQTSASSLYMIINDILDLSKVDAGMMKLNFEWFHTRSLIEDVNELVSTMALAKRLELNYIVEADVPAWVKGDKVRIRQVLLNVIGNAIKFTAQGEVFSRCRLIGRGAKDDKIGLQPNEIMLEFSVIDTGMGFTKKEAELIFKPFSQIDGSSTRQHGGSGLGLVISRQLVELHGGKMEGTAVPGKGSTFTFSAKFFIPTEEDHPDAPTAGDQADVPIAPMLSDMLSTTQLIRLPSEMSAKLSPGRQASASEVKPSSRAVSPGIEVPLTASPGIASSGSSDPSINSAVSHVTARSSMSSVNAVAGLARFSEAAKASGQDLTQMKLEMPADKEERSSSSSSIPHSLTPTPSHPDVSRSNQPSPQQAVAFRPPMYSILVICPQMHSREATVQHIEMTLPSDVPRSITAVATAADAKRLIAGDESVLFTHVVINLPAAQEVVHLVKQLEPSNAVILILSDSVQRQAVAKLATEQGLEHLFQAPPSLASPDALQPNVEKATTTPGTRATYIYKPVKPSRLAVIFDPARERDLSIDHNRSTAQRFVETQKRSYLDMERRIGNKGHKVLLVEDNTVNQKVLQRYLRKIGVEVDVVNDGVECTEKVFEKGWGYYAVILCDLHMPRKDGYQACRDIREWERKGQHPRSPIIALSANVMSDVQEKCVEAGFSDYVTKPVDFIALSQAMSKFF